jgi:uncharacterized protein
MEYFANDKLTITDQSIATDGSLLKTGVISRTGIQTYYGYEFNLPGFNATDTIKLYRPPDEILNPASVLSFEEVPVTIGHPEGNVVHSANKDKVTKGKVSNVKVTGDTVVANILVTDSEAVKLIQQGKKELSCGYAFELDMTPGFTPGGEAYHGVQRNIRGNHVAIVDQARCGSTCRIVDSEPRQPIGGHMAGETLRKMVVDGIPVEVSDQAAAVIEKLQKQIGDSVTTIEDLKKQIGGSVTVKVGDVSRTITGDQLVAEMQAKDAEIAALKANSITPEKLDLLVKSRTEVIGDAKRLIPEIAVDGKDCEAIRREVIGKFASDSKPVSAVLKGQTHLTADADTIKTAFAVLVASNPGSTLPANNDGSLFVQKVGDSSDDKPTGRQAWLDRTKNAWDSQQSGGK